MKSPIIIVLSVFVITVLGGLIYTAYLATTVSESETLGIPFTFIAVTGLALFGECIIFSLIFNRHFVIIWPILVPVFFVTSIVPIYLFINWNSNRPVGVPNPGQLPVTTSQYETDSKAVMEDYLKVATDINYTKIYQDTILTAKIDTIFYSLDKASFFAIIIAFAKDGKSQKYCANYRIGKRIKNSWQLSEPRGNIWSTCFASIQDFKKELRQYYYKSYSINNSSDKPEIWTDKYIFNLE